MNDELSEQQLKSIDLKSHVFVGKTELGWAVFALKDFCKGDLIGEVRGVLFGTEVVAGSSYCIEYDEDTIFEPLAPFRYMNHCCTPNAELTDMDVQFEDGLYREATIVTAVLPIKAGQQIMIDYAWPAENAIACHCNSPNCRGYVVAKDALPFVESAKELEQELQEFSNYEPEQTTD